MIASLIPLLALLGLLITLASSAIGLVQGKCMGNVALLKTASK